MLYLQIASPKSSVLNFLDSNSFEVIISIFQRTEKVPDMERLRMKAVIRVVKLQMDYQIGLKQGLKLVIVLIRRIDRGIHIMK